MRVDGDVQDVVGTCGTCGEHTERKRVQLVWGRVNLGCIHYFAIGRVITLSIRLYVKWGGTKGMLLRLERGGEHVILRQLY